jgi:hypothetical protein
LVNEITAGDGKIDNIFYSVAGLVIGKQTHIKKDRQAASQKAGRQVSRQAVRAFRQTCQHVCMPGWFNVCL